jgi:hypothetical protein
MPHRVPAKMPTRPRARLLAGAAVLGTVLMAGCGRSAQSPTGDASTPASAADAVASGVAFSRCIRSHGVPSFPDPKASSQTVRMGSPRIIQSPAFQSAARACQRLLPKGPPSPAPASPRAQTRMLAVSACMRKHGIPGFPDPSTSPPANLAGYSGIIDNGGYYLAIPKSIGASAPTFERAATTCNLR